MSEHPPGPLPAFAQGFRTRGNWLGTSSRQCHGSTRLTKTENYLATVHFSGDPSFVRMTASIIHALSCFLILMITILETGVLLFSATELIGTSTFVSGK